VTVGKLAAAAATLILGLTGAVATLAGAAEPATSSCAPLSDGAPVADLTAEQAANARVIVAVGQERGVSERGLLIALMTAAQESGLRNLDYGDRDSLGLFQQRPSMGWGTPVQVRDPAYAAAAFYGGPASPTGNRGLLGVPGWESMPLTVAAQAVQRSAFPNAYAKWEAPAQAWLSDILARPVTVDCQPGAGSPVVASGAAQVAITAAAQWLGTPYAWGGGSLTGPSEGFGMGAGTVGFDCSGLTRYAWAQAGILLPRTSREQWYAPAGLLRHQHRQPGHDPPRRDRPRERRDARSPPNRRRRQGPVRDLHELLLGAPLHRRPTPDRLTSDFACVLSRVSIAGGEGLCARTWRSPPRQRPCTGRVPRSGRTS